MKQVVTATLHNWFYDGVYPVYWGNIYDDINGRFRDGTMIHTSAVIPEHRHKHRGGCLIKTMNSTYRLGRRRKKV